MTRLRGLHYCLLLIAVLACAASPSYADPVNTFIAEADSIVQNHGDEALSRYISDHSVLVGAVVGTLVDIAIEVGDQGDTENEKGNLDFAVKIARLAKHNGGASGPLELATTYQSWSADQRATRREARELEQKAAEAGEGEDFGGADALYIEARALYEAIGDQRSVAVTWGSMGVNAWYAGDFESVLEYYNEALVARREIDDQILVGKTLNGLGSANRAIGNTDAAVDWYSQAIELRRRTVDIAGFTKSVTYLSAVYLNSGRLLEARQTMEQAVPLLSESGDATETINAYTTIGNIHSTMGNLDKANEAYSQAISMSQDAGDALREVIARNNRAGNWRRQFRYGEALAELDATESLLRDEPDVEQAVILHRERGLIYRATRELDRARDELLKSREAAGALDDPFYQTQALINLSLLYQDLGAYDRGLAAARQSLEMAAQAQAPGLYADAAINTATLLRLSGQYEESLEYWEEARAQAEVNETPDKVIEATTGSATVYAKMGDEERARELYGVAMDLSERSQDRGYEAAITLGVGHTYEATDPEQAARYYEEALALHEAWRASLGGAEAGSAYLSGERRFFYEEVARFYSSLDSDEKDGKWAARAFGIIERAKARGLLDLIEQTLAGEMTAEEAEVLDAIYALDADASDDRARLEKRYSELRQARITQSTEKLEVGGVSDIKTVQRALPRNAIMLQYALGDSASLLWVVDRKHYTLHTLPDRAALSRDIEQLRDAIARPGQGDDALRQTAWRLYSSLIAPAEDQIGNAQTVVIVPDGALFEVPFEVLLTKEPNGDASWSEQPFFARRHATVYAPSASVFVRLEEEKKGSYGKVLLAVGDPDFTTVEPKPGAPPLAQLPHTRVEVENISTHVKKSSDKAVLVGGSASESALKRELRGKSPRILHLATHGLVDPVEPASSSVVLCADDKDDGYFHTLEILSLPIDVELVVVSACESGRGKVSRSEGVVGLSRAFIASGADGVVASLWAVSDESTARLMTTFYDSMLGEGRPASRALSEARLALLDNPDYAHPFYWSPFIVIGGPTAMSSHEGDTHTSN